MGKKKSRRSNGAHKRLHVSRRIIRRRGKKPGASPGTMVHTGEKRVEETRLTLIRYGTQGVESGEIARADIGECFPPADESRICWLNVDGLHDTELLHELGRRAGLHGLVLEDVVSVGQRPKQEEYEDHHFIVLRMLRWDDNTHQVEEEQLSLVLGPRHVMSFQEAAGDSFDPIRERILHGKGQIRTRGADYLAYALMDAVVDEYFVVVEKLGDRLEELEQELLDNPRPSSVVEVHRLKNELLVMRKAVWPLRDLFNTLLRDESPLFTSGTRIFLRDAYDHAVQVIDSVETLRDITSGLIDMYLSSMSNRMNETMKALTLIGTIFIPLTFVVGIYGMNFDYMPELQWPWAYPLLWLIMAGIAAVMFVWFRRRSWL